jgi:hypothetical protein
MIFVVASIELCANAGPMRASPPCPQLRLFNYHSDERCLDFSQNRASVLINFSKCSSGEHCSWESRRYLDHTQFRFGDIIESQECSSDVFVHSTVSLFKVR